MGNHAMLRTRWAALGAAVAITLGAGGIGIADATISSGERTSYVPITPCRLADTRRPQVGGRSAPLGPGETYTLDGRGTIGNCTIPAGATGLGLNVTAVDATEQTNLRFYPAGAALPKVANLNPTPGAPPTPNAVTVDLAANGRFSVFNRFGSVAVVIDVVGYYEDHDHDDRYYTEDEVDDMLIPRGYGQVRVVGTIPSTIYWDMAFVGAHPGFLSARTPGGGVTCLKPDPAVLTVADVQGGFLQDASGNDTRLYFNGSFDCDDDEVRVVQKLNLGDDETNQSFNVLVP